MHSDVHPLVWNETAACVCEDPLERTDKLSAPAVLVWLEAMGCSPHLDGNKLVLDKAMLTPGGRELVRLTWRRISSCARRKGGAHPHAPLPHVEAVFAMAGVLDLRLRLKAAEGERLEQAKRRARSTPSR